MKYVSLSWITLHSSARTFKQTSLPPDKKWITEHEGEWSQRWHAPVPLKYSTSKNHVPEAGDAVNSSQQDKGSRGDEGGKETPEYYLGNSVGMRPLWRATRHLYAAPTGGQQRSQVLTVRCHVLVVTYPTCTSTNYYYRESRGCGRGEGVCWMTGMRVGVTRNGLSCRVRECKNNLRNSIWESNLK